MGLGQNVSESEMFQNALQISRALHCSVLVTQVVLYTFSLNVKCLPENTVLWQIYCCVFSHVSRSLHINNFRLLKYIERGKCRRNVDK